MLLVDEQVLIIDHADVISMQVYIVVYLLV